MRMTDVLFGGDRNERMTDIGLLTRPAAFLLVGHFAIVVLVAHAGQTFKERELPFLFLVIALTLLFTGAGRYSVDAAVRDRTSYN